MHATSTKERMEFASLGGEKCACRRSVTFTFYITWCSPNFYFLSGLRDFQRHNNEVGRKSALDTYITQPRRNLKKHWKQRRNFFSIPKPKNHRLNAYTHRRRANEEEKWFLCALEGKVVKIFILQKKASFVHVCVDAERKFSKFHLFRELFSHQKAQLFFHANRMPHRSSMKWNYKYLCLCSCFAALEIKMWVWLWLRKAFIPFFWLHCKSLNMCDERERKSRREKERKAWNCCWYKEMICFCNRPTWSRELHS